MYKYCVFVSREFIFLYTIVKIQGFMIGFTLIHFIESLRDLFLYASISYEDVNGDLPKWTRTNMTYYY